MTRLIMTMMLAAVLGAGASARTLEVLEGTYEVELGEVSMPRSPVGTVQLKVCDTCPTVGHPVTPHTRYSIGGTDMPHRRFLEVVEEIRKRDGGNSTTMVGVGYSLETNQATWIAVFPLEQ